MGREIKFEFVWSTGDITGAYTLEELFDLSGEEELNEKTFECTCCLHEGMPYCEGDCVSDEQTNATVIAKRQYTGLKDKNGKDIYESDILDLGQTVNGVSQFIVVWDKERIGWSVEYNAKMNIPRNYEYDLPSFFKICDLTEEGVKVIGNIYQDKELLNK